jgi:hypothetical protein
MDLPVGAGVWLAGTSFATVEANVITRSSSAVVVTGPSHTGRVVLNVVSSSEEADIAWAGIGANVCFADNATPSGASVTSTPPAAETIYTCELPATVGIPMPLISVRLIAGA